METILLQCGLTKDESNSKLKEVLKDNARLNEIHIDAYPENPLIASSAPFVLLLRTIEKNAVVSIDGDRLILKRNDRFETHLMNVLLTNVVECFYKTSDYCSEFILNIQNIYYRFIVFN